MKTLPCVPSVMRVRIFFIFFMFSEQVNLIHERQPYGNIEKSTKSLHPTNYVKNKILLKRTVTRACAQKTQPAGLI